MRLFQRRGTRQDGDVPPSEAGEPGGSASPTYEVRASTVAQAVEAFEKATQLVDIIDDGATEGTYHDVRDGSWPGCTRVVGPYHTIRELLRRNLVVDDQVRGYSEFLISVHPDDPSIRISSIRHELGRFIGYRIRRHSSGYSLLSSESICATRVIEYEELGDIAPDQRRDYADQLKEKGDLFGSYQFLRSASESTEQDFSVQCTTLLATFMEDHGNTADAKELYWQAIHTGHVEHGARAALRLGALLEKQRDLNGAHQAYEIAIESGHPSISQGALLGLGDVLALRGKKRDARQAYERVAASGHSTWAPRALQRLNERR